MHRDTFDQNAISGASATCQVSTKRPQNQESARAGCDTLASALTKRVAGLFDISLQAALDASLEPLW